MFYSILTETRQGKPGRFQIKSLETFSDNTFHTPGTVRKLRNLEQEILISLFSDFWVVSTVTYEGITTHYRGLRISE